MAEYDLLIRTPGGTKVGEITDYRELAYRKVLNGPGLGSFVLDGQHPKIALLQDKAQIEFRRRDRARGLKRYTDFYAIYRAQRRTRATTETFVARCPGALHLLSWPVIGYPSGISNQTVFTAQKAETILKRLVRFNAGAEATTANGRARTKSMTPFTITTQADAAGGTTLDWSCFGKRLLPQLQELARVAGGDIDLIKTGPATYEFRFYPGQRGVDRRSSVIFAVDRGNLTDVALELDRTTEATVAIVWGEGEGATRPFLIRTGATYAADNDIELIVDRRSPTVAAQQADGDAELDATRARRSFSGTILQTAGCAYGVHYCVGGALGDLVRVHEFGVTYDQQIVGVNVQARPDGTDAIDVEVADI